MERKQFNLIVLIISIAYGTAMALLPDRSGATNVIAIIGGAVVAIGWITAGVLFTRARTRGHE